MARTVTAIFDGEVFRPTEPLDLPAHAEYRLTIDEQTPVASEDEFPLMRYLKLAQDLDLPSDFAEQHDHYLYGTPKR
jgi:hypothetical protein